MPTHSSAVTCHLTVVFEYRCLHSLCSLFTVAVPGLTVFSSVYIITLVPSVFASVLSLVTKLFLSYVFIVHVHSKVRFMFYPLPSVIKHPADWLGCSMRRRLESHILSVCSPSYFFLFSYKWVPLLWCERGFMFTKEEDVHRFKKKVRFLMFWSLENESALTSQPIPLLVRTSPY